MQERSGAVTFKGSPLTLLGPEVQPGQQAPDVALLDADLAKKRLSDFPGKIRVIITVPSLDTPVCDAEVRAFNRAATGMGEDVVVLAVSMDLPFAQARWCAGAGIDRVTTLSDHREAAFGTAWGVLIKPLRLLARAVFVVDPAGRIAYVQVVPELTDEPDYDDVLRAVAELRS
ncbi:hypothetical protein LCGC14_1492430 [marine sediment metagenome]|uniref:Thioredoxin domain-containing protein n=1 Tax=marine sediment metagenome TaxID=412755 RepID=A0A0F9LLW5_9ZZZZ